MRKNFDDACPFCAIIKRKLKADILAETDHAMAFRDINPVAKTHILVIPKTHFSSISDLSEQNGRGMSEVLLLIKDVAKKLGLDKSGYRLVINSGKDAGQTVFHLHAHILGGRVFSWPPG